MWASIVGAIAKPLTDLIDDLHTSDEEKGKIRLALMATQVEMGGKLLEYETERMTLQQKVITAEAASASAITRLWRPVTMLTFLSMIVSHWLGYTPPNVSEAMVSQLMGLIELGLVGYIAGRSAEKVIPQVAQIFKKDV